MPRPTVVNHPLDWYIAKLYNKEAFASLLYGDGEFQIMLGKVTGPMQNGETPSRQLREELLASLDDPSSEVVRGTDPNLIHYEAYEGRDFRALWDIGMGVVGLLREKPVASRWVDGVVWDRAVRAGELGPFFRALRQRDVIMIGNPALWGNPNIQRAIRPRHFVSVPETNACATVDSVERYASCAENRGRATVYLVCCGLSAIPLIMRMRKTFPVSTFLDLGSTFDIFAGLGRERGWRAELYADERRLKTLISKNLETED